MLRATHFAQAIEALCRSHPTGSGIVHKRCPTRNLIYTQETGFNETQGNEIGKLLGNNWHNLSHSYQLEHQPKYLMGDITWPFWLALCNILRHLGLTLPALLLGFFSYR